MNFETQWRAGHPVFHNVSNQENILLILLPLFEDSNRLRKPVIDAMHMLSTRGIGCALPDLPGCGESLFGADALTLNQLREAAIAVAGEMACNDKALFVASFRSACLFDIIPGARGLWRLAPENGDKLIRTLLRTGDGRLDDPRHRFVAGQYLPSAFVDELSAATVDSNLVPRVVRLASDRADADFKFEGSPLWRRSEPSEDIPFSQHIADDISHWIETCAAS